MPNHPHPHESVDWKDTAMNNNIISDGNQLTFSPLSLENTPKSKFNHLRMTLSALSAPATEHTESKLSYIFYVMWQNYHL